MARLSTSPAGGARGGITAQARPHGAAAAAPGRDDRPRSNGRRNSGAPAALSHAARHRVDDRRRHAPFDYVREACHAHAQRLDRSRPAQHFRQHDPRPAFRSRAAGELGASFRRERWRRDDRRPAAAPGHRARQRRPRRASPAAGRCAGKRARMVGLRSHRRGPRSHRTSDPGCSPERSEGRERSPCTDRQALARRSCAKSSPNDSA